MNDHQATGLVDRLSDSFNIERNQRHEVDNFRFDYGDAPISYGVLSSQNGAKHVVALGVHLGTDLSKDPDGKPSAAKAAS